MPLVAQSPPGGLQKPTRGKEGSHLGRSLEGFHPSTSCPPDPMPDSSPVGKMEAGLWPGELRGMGWLGNGGLPANLFPQPHIPFSAALAARCYSRLFLRPGNPEPPKHSLHVAWSSPRCDSGPGSSKGPPEPSSPGGRAGQVEEGRLITASPSASRTSQRWPKQTWGLACRREHQ